MRALSLSLNSISVLQRFSQHLFIQNRLLFTKNIKQEPETKTTGK